MLVMNYMISRSMVVQWQIVHTQPMLSFASPRQHKNTQGHSDKHVRDLQCEGDIATTGSITDVCYQHDQKNFLLLLP